MKKCPQLLSGQLTCVLLCAARSPVFSHLSSSLQGLWTIRAFRAEERFQEVFDAHQNLHSRKPPLPPVASHSAGVELADGCFFWSRLRAEAWFLFLTTSRWFALRLDAICSVFVTVTTFGCLILRDRKHIAPPQPFSSCSHVWSLTLKCVLVRVGGGSRWLGSVLRHHPDGNVPVGCEAKHRGGEHGEFTSRSSLFALCWSSLVAFWKNEYFFFALPRHGSAHPRQ